MRLYAWDKKNEMHIITTFSPFPVLHDFLLTTQQLFSYATAVTSLTQARFTKC